MPIILPMRPFRSTFLAGFLFVLAIIPSIGFSEAESSSPYPEEEQALRQVVDDIIFAIVEGDAGTLSYYSRLNDSFQFSKDYWVKYHLQAYSGGGVRTSGIDVEKVRVSSPSSAKVMVKVHLTSVDGIGGLATAPRAEVWNFVKGEEGDERGRWLVLIDKA